MALAAASYPPRIDLARLPTPLQPLRRWSEKLGVDLHIKRDDLTGCALSGNKIRKLEFALADARAKRADTVVTCGGEQSNHCRATAVAAAMLGLHCRLLLRTADPAAAPPPDGNLLLDRMAGAEIVWITPEQYRRRDEIFEREAGDLRRRGRAPYIIPEGASDAVGAWGYISATEELVGDIAGVAEEDEPVTVIHACGSGGTAAGLILGAKLSARPFRIASVNVCDDRDYFVEVVGEICEKAIAACQLNIAFDRNRDIDIVDGYVGRGYALSRPEELSLICELARTEGIFLDPVYTGKAFFGMVQELQRDPQRFGRRIVFVHTGGIFGLFPMAQQIAALL
jgi:D-cysteine desulfhydrase